MCNIFNKNKSHDHAHDHSHSHRHDHADTGDTSNEIAEFQAILKHILQHNEHHVVELGEMANKAKNLHLDDVCDRIYESTKIYKKANELLNSALSGM